MSTHLTIVWLAVMVVAATLSFYFSGMEAGVFAVNRVRIRHWMHQGRKGADRLSHLLERPESFLWTVLVGNMLANVVIVTVGLVLLIELCGDNTWLIWTLLAVGVYVFHLLCDLLPKVLFQRFPNRLCLIAVRPFGVLRLVLGPVTALLRWAVRLLLLRSRQERVSGLSGGREELRLTLLETEPSLTSDERLMIGRVLELKSAKVGQLATPLKQAVLVEEKTPLGELFRVCRERQLTRVPVWSSGARQRRIAGVVSLKTLLFQPDLDAKRLVGEFLKPALYLPEELGVEEALRRMQRSGHRLAIVLGAQRQEVGLISLKDILRFLFGEVTV